MNIHLSNKSFIKGDTLKVSIDFSCDYKILQKAKKINVSIFRIDKERNHFVFSFTTTIECKFNLYEYEALGEIPISCSEGVYCICEINLINDEEQINFVQTKDFEPIFFWYSPELNIDLSVQELNNKVNLLKEERELFINATLMSDNVIKESENDLYKVFVFGVGCLIHTTQTMEGYTLHPLGRGYGYSHMLDAVNSFLTTNCSIKLETVNSIKDSFSAATPLFVIEYRNVEAINFDDARDYCTSLSESMFTILSYEKGQRPNLFASIIINKKTNEISQQFSFPNYKGNLIGDFSPSWTSDLIEKLLPKIKSSSWIELLIKIYVDAENDNNLYYACLKYWSILEIIAKKEVTNNTEQLAHPNGNNILDNGGNIVTTQSTRGKVYRYIYDCHISPSIINVEDNTKFIFESYTDGKKHSLFDEHTSIITLWDMVCVLYQIRNSTAHSGKFDIELAKTGNDNEKLSAKMLSNNYPNFFIQIKFMLKEIIFKEIDKV